MSTITELEEYVEGIRRRLEQFLNESVSPLDSVSAVAQSRYMQDVPAERGGAARPKSMMVVRTSTSGGTTDCAVVGFKAAYGRFKRVGVFLANMREQYRTRMETLLVNFKDGLDGLSDVRKRFDAAYSRYQQLGGDLQRAADRRAPNLADLKAQFKAAQCEAVELHTHMNELTAQTAVKLEGSMTSYEEIEQWRSDELKRMLNVIAEWGDDFAKQLDDGLAKWAGFLRAIPDDSALDELFDCSDLPKPLTDDRYQLVRIDRRATQHLEPAAMFISEQKKKGVLYKVTTSCMAHGEFLAVTAGEIICVTEDKGDVVMAVNINDARGLLPKTILAPFP